MKLTGKNGILRISDSSAILHGTAPLAALTPDMVFYVVGVWLNVTTETSADDASSANDFLKSTADMMCVGSTSKFAMVQYLKGIGANYAVGSGALIAKYWNGSILADLTGVVDVTASGGDCFGQDGYISFHIPKNWALGANAYNAALDADKYYVFFQETASSNPDPDADVLCPVEGQYQQVPFALMDFSGPIGKARPEEILVLDRGLMSADGHYLKGPDDKLMEPQEIAFSCYIHSTYADRVRQALICNNPGAGTWTGTGVSSKGDTKNDGTNSNPAFADANKKAVNVQIKWALSSGYAFGMAYYESWFDEKDITLEESADGIVLKAKGLCYGVIEQIFGFGNRY